MNKKNRFTLVMLCFLFVMFSKNMNVKAISQSQAQAIVNYAGANGTEHYTPLSDGCADEVDYFTIGGERFYDTISPSEIAVAICGADDTTGCLNSNEQAAINKINTITSAAKNLGFTRQNDGSYAKHTGNYPIGCYRSSYSGVRVSIVNEDGTKKNGTSTIDYWQSNPGILIGNIQKGNNLRTIIVNGANANFQTVPSIGGTIDGNMGNYYSARNTLKNEVIQSSSSKTIKSNGYLKQLGINKWENFDEDDHILFEPLFVVTIGKINYVGTGTEIFSLLMQHPEATWIRADFIKTITGQMTLTEMLNEPKDDNDMTYTLNSNGAKYIPYNRLEQSSNGLKNNPSLVLRQANGYAMELIWLKPYLEKPEKCCVPCNPETTDCSKVEGYKPEDPNCCYENGSISEDGTMEACVPPDQYWDNRDEQHNWDLVCSKCCIPTEENDWCCDPSNTLIFENGACEPWGEYWNDKKERYKRYCIQEECPPITLTGDSYCKLADCDEPDNVSIFSDPLLKNLVSDDGSVDVDEITNQLEENIEKYIANQNDTFLAVAYQGETYREAIDYNGRDNEFCDLYCQEVAIVKFPDVYPAANAGRYFQWSISDEETGTLVTQEIVKVCAEDIKYDDFMKKYIKFDEETINKVSFVANYHVGTYCGPLRVFYYGGITCSTAGEIRYAECMNSCQAILNSNACDNLKGSAAESCQKALEEQYQQCIQTCPAAKAKEIERCKKTEISYSELKAKWESGYPETYKEKYNEFLSCFSDDINNEIITDLDLKLHYGDNVYDSSNYEKVEGDVISNFTDFHCKQSDECNTGTYYTADTLFNTTNFCSNENFMPREAYDSITDSQKELDEMIKIGTGINNNANYDSMKVPIKFSISFPCDSDLQHDWETHGSHSSDPRMDFCLNNFLYGDYSSNYTINYNFDSVSFSELAGKTLYDLNGGYDEKGFIPNKLMDMNALDFYVCSLVGKYSDSITSCKEYYNLFYGDYFSDYAYPVEAKDNTSNKNFCFRVSDIYTHTNGDDSRSNASFGNFPLSVSGYDVKKNIWLSLDYTNDSNINKDNINYQNTLRFIILQKKDNYILADFVNACTCSDGIVMDAKESDDGSLYCPCKPETFESNYDNSSSDVDADLIIKDTYGICKYSAYDTIDIGGTYTIAYMTGSGTYPLTIDYSNIGSIDNDVAHFSKLSEECGCSGSTCVYDGNMCKISIGNSIMNDNWSYQETNGWSLKASYYICKGGECYDPKCPPGECHVPEPKPKPQPDFECINGDCVEGLSLIYRSVDLNNPFPGGNNNSDSRTAGENWFGNENRITNNRGLNGTELYSSIDIKPLYYFKFTPSLIKDIRKYNVENGRDYANSSSIAYIDNKLRDDEGNYNVGFSQVLRNDIAGIFVETASANGDSLDKWFRIVTDVDDCSEEETLDTYCYEMSTSWEEYISQGDSSCWDLAKSYLGVK